MQRNEWIKATLILQFEHIMCIFSSAIHWLIVRKGSVTTRNLASSADRREDVVKHAKDNFLLHDCLACPQLQTHD